MPRGGRSRSHASGTSHGSTATTHDRERGIAESNDGHVSLISTPSLADEGSNVPDSTSRPAAAASTTRDSSYSSRTAFGGPWMSANPTTEVEESLRSPDLTSPVRDHHSAASTSSSDSGREGQEIAQRGTNDDGMDVQSRQGSRDKMDPTLPENDGMRALREKMHEIRTLAISTEEKAKMMHYLMTQDYMALRAVATSPLSMDSGNSKAVDEEPAALDVGLAAMPIDPSNPFNLRTGDAEPSWSPLPPNPRDEEMEGSMELDMPNLGCRHYKRNVKVQCFDCHRWFPCRHCHDAAPDLPFPHNLRRKMTTNMLCMLCATPQAAAEACANCGEYAAYYFCPKCKLWDNDTNKRIYHCDDCGICRVGEGLGKDFVHCKRCNVCISISTSAAHPCVEGATERDCPLCLDDLFESRKKAVSMPCGHYMHGECYQELMRVTYKCPVCSKSAVNMELQWRKLDDEIRAQPMPEDEEELGNLLPHAAGQTDENVDAEDPDRSTSLPTARRPRTVYIGCNDCGRRSWTPFHWLGAKCQHCDSYNTNQMAPPAGHESEAERLLRQQQVQHRHHDFTGEGVLRDAGIRPTGADDEPGQLRADSALDVPASPAQLAVPGSPRSSAGSSLPSPRRYFVQDDDEDAPPRRPSFTARGFSTPSLPHLPDLPRLPRMPDWPGLPMPDFPRDWPNLPSVPTMPSMAGMRMGMAMPHLDLPRFSPYGVMDSLSRSLSPMRYYLQGLDMSDDGVLGRERRRESGLRRMESVRERDASPTSVRSDPTADATEEKRRVLEEELDLDFEDEGAEGWGMGVWGARARRFWPREQGVGVGNHDEVAVEDGSEDEGSESGSSSEDAEMRDGFDDEDDDLDDEEDELALFGHR